MFVAAQKMIFSWWNSQTIGTWLTTKLYGEPVGTDAFGTRLASTVAAAG